IERDPLRIVRPHESRDFEASACQLSEAAICNGRHVEMIPAVDVADKSDPSAVRRGNRLGVQVCEAPESGIDISMEHLLSSAFSIGYDDLAREEVGAHSLNHDTVRIGPPRRLVAAG